MYEELKKKLGDKVKENEPLAFYTTYKVGGPADLFYNATSIEELEKAITLARDLNIPFFILGGGSNILIGDKGFRGLVIKNTSSGISINGMTGKMKDSTDKRLVYLKVDSGVPMNKLVRFTIEEGLSGLEMHLGLPGSVGGAIAMNSKWMKPPGFVGDCLYRALILTPDNELKHVDKAYFHFSYGYSILQKNSDVLLQVIFALEKKDKDALWNQANESITYRRDSQPQGVHTAGCIFKNISPALAITHSTPDHQTSAGYLLDKSGCVGLKVGQAEVSDVHANFIITKPGATASDVIELIDLMKRNVKKTFGITLLEEILKIGEFE